LSFHLLQSLANRLVGCPSGVSVALSFLPRHRFRCSAIVRSTDGDEIETKKAVRTDPEWKGQHPTGGYRQPLTGPESDLTALLCWLSTSNGSDYTHPETVCKMAYREGIEPPSLDLESKALPLDERHVTGAATRNRTPDLLLTRQLLYQLSYDGLAPRAGIEPASHGLTVRPHTTVRFVEKTLGRGLGGDGWIRTNST